ncbi:ADP-ribosylglycohydrolase family protein [Neobacillus vireti]|uniref:ADP-ribosylglycohydrolase family protein n=1 Tax=Neobacillus vireti TaxID=220686 RepID=UPI002FFEFD85
MLDKMKGGLLGFAAGDAMGVATEFMSPEEIKEQYGVVTEILGGGVFGFESGETSDDTDMTIAVAKGIIANSTDPIEDIGKEFLKWRATNPKDIGITIATTFRNYQGDWFNAAELTHQHLEQSGGNGTLMRCLPIAFAYSDIKKMEEVSILQSKMTHHEDSASEACVIYNRIARRLLHGEELKSAIATEIKNTQYDIDYSKEPDCPPSGYVVHTLKWVFYWLLNKDSFLDVMIGAVNMGNDSDTIAAIAGGLKGLEVGYGRIPYKDFLLNHKYLDELAEVLFEIRDKDTLEVKENQADYLQEVVNVTHQIYELAERGGKPAAMMNSLRENLFLYRASLLEDQVDFKKKYDKWWKIQVRFKRSRRLMDLGAPDVIIQNELYWLKLEAEHLNQIHQGVEPEYTSDEFEELESLRQTELAMEDDMRQQGFIK